MLSPFYNEFDTCPLSMMSGISGPGRQEGEHRSPFQLDRDRVVFSFAFRRLQSKTQVFHSGEYDFYRTRLTHSLEVARIARSINDWLQSQPDNPLPHDHHIDGDLLEVVGLSHDLGHPPFGHIGERKLNELMEGYGGFEGNAQTLRILTELIYERREGTRGMLPTRALLDGVMKYKALWGERGGQYRASQPAELPQTEPQQSQQPAAAAGHPEAAKATEPAAFSSLHTGHASQSGQPAQPTPPANKFLYNEQKKYRDFIFGGSDLPAELRDWRRVDEAKSIECQIMDWADDTAYSLHDIVDGVKAGFLTHESISRWAAEKGKLEDDEQRWIEKLLQAIREEKLEAVISLKIGSFIRACSLQPYHSALSHLSQRHAWYLHVDANTRAECTLYKELALDIIFRSSLIQQLEFKGGYVLERLFNALAENYLSTASGKPKSSRLKLVPEMVNGWLIKETDPIKRARLLCDYLASLTDHQAQRLYKRLFDPDFGSISDLG